MNIVACGALANELTALKQLNGWDHLRISCLPAHYHQTPQRIPGAVKSAIEKIRLRNDDPILVAYGDCGTGGKLDKVLTEAGVERLPGAHCYQFFAGNAEFMQMHEAEIGTFYLTDFLVRHFDTYVIKALGLDRKPELMEMYFGNYTRLMYLAQTQSEALIALAKTHAETLGLEYAYHYTAFGELGSALSSVMSVAVPEPELCQT
jgi:hypothetical protein